MIFKRKYSRFHISPRYNRTLQRLIRGCEEVRTLQDGGQIITAEKKYNKKLCYAYGECRHLLKRRAEEIEANSDDPVGDLEQIKAAFLSFYALAEGYGVDIAEQRADALAFIEKAEAVFLNKTADAGAAPKNC